MSTHPVGVFRFDRTFSIEKSSYISHTHRPHILDRKKNSYMSHMYLSIFVAATNRSAAASSSAAAIDASPAFRQRGGIGSAQITVSLGLMLHTLSFRGWVQNMERHRVDNHEWEFLHHATIPNCTEATGGIIIRTAHIDSPAASLPRTAFGRRGPPALEQLLSFDVTHKFLSGIGQPTPTLHPTRKKGSQPFPEAD